MYLMREKNNNSNHSPLNEKWLKQLLLKLDLFVDEQHEMNQHFKNLFEIQINISKATYELLKSQQETHSKQSQQIVDALKLIAKKLP